MGKAVTSNTPANNPKRLADVSLWLAIYLLLWLLLSGGQGLIFGLACALGASLLSVALGLKPTRLRLRYLPGFVAFFFYEMIIGAWDVARRAFHPQLPLDPAWVSYSLACPNSRVQLLLYAMVGLIPGTLATRLVDGEMRLHVLDQRQPWRTSLAQMETHLDRLFGD